MPVVARSQIGQSGETVWSSSSSRSLLACWLGESVAAGVRLATIPKLAANSQLRAVTQVLGCVSGLDGAEDSDPDSSAAPDEGLGDELGVELGDEPDDELALVR